MAVRRGREGAHGGVSRTIERCVHAADVDQQAHHGHVDGGRALGEQLVLEDLAALAALGHGVEVDVGKRVAARAIRLLGEDAAVILEDELEEVELDVLAPQRDAVVLFEVLDLVAAVDGRDAAVGIAARRRRRGRVVGPRRVAVVGRALRVGGIAASFALVGHRRVGLRGVGLRVVHGVRLSSQNVSQAVAGVGLVGARSLCHDEGATRGLALALRASACTSPVLDARPDRIGPEASARFQTSKDCVSQFTIFPRLQLSRPDVTWPTPSPSSLGQPSVC